MNNRLLKLGMYFIWGILLAAAIVMSVDSLLRSTYFTTGQEIEIPSYTWDNPLMVIIGGIVWIGAIYLLVYKINFFRKNTLTRLLLCIAVVQMFLILLLRAYPACDGGALSEIAVSFMEGDYSALGKPNYLSIYPFQLGMTGFIQLIYTIFGQNNYMVLQFINILASLGIAYVLYQITWLLFNDETVLQYFCILLIAMLPLHLYTTFIYGNLLGLCFSLLAILFVICFMREGKWRYTFLAGAAIGIGILFKSNSRIFLIAIEIVLLMFAVCKKNAKVLLAGLIILILSRIPVYAVEGYYLRQSGVERISEGVPGAAWIAMGLQDDDLFENGWYNGYNINTYKQCEFDNKKAAEQSLDSIGESVKTFVKHPLYAVRFFYKKWTSQWNDPTYQSLFSVEWACRHNENQSVLARSLYSGRVAGGLYHFMNIYQTIYFIGALFFLLKGRSRLGLEQFILLLSVFGGMLCHLLWEAKGRYVFSYYILLLPFAAYGINKLVEGVKVLCIKWKDK